MKLTIQLRGFEDKIRLYLKRFLEIRRKGPGKPLRNTFYKMLDMFEKYYDNPEFGVRASKKQQKDIVQYHYVCKLGKIARYNGLLDWDNIVDERRYSKQVNICIVIQMISKK